jgi:uncharacterized protein YukE
MATITVSPEMLREKARIIRALLNERKAAHQQLWAQMSANARQLPIDLTSTHFYANSPWNQAIEAQYANYYQLALNMEAAANAYERGDYNFQISFNELM